MFHRRALALLFVALLHAGAAWYAMLPGEPVERATRQAPLIAVFLVRPLPATPRAPVSGRSADPVSVHLTPTPDAPTFAGTQAAYPRDPEPPPRALARALGIPPEAPVAVLVAVEVLGTRQLGAITVLSSSGVPAIDRAAIEYVRGLDWQGAFQHGVPQRTVVRYAVYFQA